jgi:hypothetical protein
MTFFTLWSTSSLPPSPLSPASGLHYCPPTCLDLYINGSVVFLFLCLACATYCSPVPSLWSEKTEFLPLGGGRIWTQGLALARLELCPWNHASYPISPLLRQDFKAPLRMEATITHPCTCRWTLGLVLWTAPQWTRGAGVSATWCTQFPWLLTQRYIVEP